MDRYYYLAAQLPALRFAVPVPLSRREFLAEAGKWMDEKTFSSLSRADISRADSLPADPPVMRAYACFEKRLRKELGQWRRARSEQQGYVLPPDIAELVAEGTPLEIERRLLLARWIFLEEQEAGHYFDLDFLTAFFLKLQLLERVLTFDKEKGTEVFDTVCEVTYG